MSRPALLHLLFAAAATLCAPAGAADAPPFPLLELSAEASVEAANDVASVEAYYEATGASPGTLADEVNRAMAEAGRIASAYPAVKLRSGANTTMPLYNRNGRSIDAWRMRAALTLESRDLKVLTELVGRLQERLAVSSLQLAPAPETRRKAEDAALVEALRNFEARARLAAETLGRRYRIHRLVVGGGGLRPPPMPAFRAAMAAGSEVAPPPLEAGASTIRVEVTGSVELLD